jgi:precorrin-8X/cobalt-precorrin-8 methylmutase
VSTPGAPGAPGTPDAPDAIETRSFAIIDQEAGPDPLFQGRAWEIARRLVHATADFAILPDLRLPEAAIDAGVKALRAGAPVFADTEMARCGMTSRHLTPFGIRPRCLLDLPGVAERAAQNGGTRSRAAMELAAALLPGAIVAVGNAPTALLALVDQLRAGLTPALVVAMPVGFVNAAESKELCVAACEERNVPCLALMGRKGGSALAAAAINALAGLASARPSAPAGNREHGAP